VLAVKGEKLYLHKQLASGEVETCDKNRKDKRHGIASITKSITSLMFGWVNSGPDFGDPLTLNTPAREALRNSVDYPDPDVTILDLLQMSSGMRYENERDVRAVRVEEGRPECQNPDDDPTCSLRGQVQTFLNGARFEASEGRRSYNYSNLDTTLLGFIVEDRGKEFERAGKSDLRPHFGRIGGVLLDRSQKDQDRKMEV